MAIVPPRRAASADPDGVPVSGNAVFDSPFFSPDEACPLCYEPFEGRAAMQFACNHVACSVCVLNLFKQSELAACPMCSASCSRQRAKAMLGAASEASVEDFATIFGGKSAEDVVGAMGDGAGAQDDSEPAAAGTAFASIGDGSAAGPGPSFAEAPLEHVARGAMPALPPGLDLAPEACRPRMAEAMVTFAGEEGPAVLAAAVIIRKSLAIEHSPPLAAAVDGGVVPHAVRHMRDSADPRLQFEALWIVTNVASGSSAQTRTVVDAGALPELVRLLASPLADVREQAAWCIGNIAGDCAELRDVVLASGVTEAMPLLMSVEDQPLSLRRNCTWSCSNLVRGKPQPPLDTIRPLIPALARCMLSDDEEILSDACWGLSYVSDGENDRIQAVLDCGVAARLVEVMETLDDKVKVPALRTLGNIVTGDDAQTQAVLDAGAIPCLVGSLSSARQGVVKESCWALSNIAAGSASQIQALLNANALTVMAEHTEGADPKVAGEATWVVANAFSGGTTEQVQAIVADNCLRVLAQGMALPDPRIIATALDGLRAGMDKGGVTPGDVVNAGMDSTIDELTEHSNSQIHSLAVNIAERLE